MEEKTLGYFVSIYAQFATAENKSPRTIDVVTDAVRGFDTFLGGCPDPNYLRAEDLRRYIIYLQQRARWAGHPTIKPNHGHLSPDAIASYIRSIRAFWSWLEQEKFIAANPMAAVKPPKAPVKMVTPLTQQDIEQLLKVIPRNGHKGFRDATIVLTLYGTGLRVSELLELKVSAVDFDSGQIRVLGKGSKERSVYMSPSVFKMLLKYYSQWRPKEASDYFFVADSGGRLQRFYLEHRLKTCATKARLARRCTPHMLRYSFALQVIRNGCDPFTLQKILGHATLDMTRRYVRLASTDVEKTMKAFSPAEQLNMKV